MSRLIREFNLRQENKDSTNLPTRAVVTRALPEEEAVYLDSGTSPGLSKYQISHPYMGVNSWIRVMPEAGTEVLTVDRGDAPSDVIITYMANSMIPRLKAARQGKQLLRVLNPGEIELMSSGRAYAFLSDAGDIELRGGMIRLDVLQTEQELTCLSPTYVRRLHLNEPDKLTYTERFGVVKRPDTTLPNAMQQYVRRTPSGSTTKEFAFEYGRWLSDGAGNILCTLQEGHVYDESAAEKKQGSTNKPLRYERLLIDKTGNQDITVQADEELNLYYSNSSNTSKEAKLSFGSLVTLDVSTNQYKMSVTKTGNIRYGTSLTLTSPKVDIKSSNVNFGNNPIIPAVLGTPLINSVLTPLVTALQAFMQLYGVDAVFSNFSPQTVASANALAATLSAVSSSLSSALSQQVKLSG